MKEATVDRRAFLRRGITGTALLAAGSAAGWLLGRRRATAPKPGPEITDAKFALDVSELKKVDPALMVGRHVADIPLDFQRVRRFLVTPDDQFLVAGDTSVKLVSRDGVAKTLLSLGRPPLCLATDAEHLYVGIYDHVEVFDHAGTPVAKWAGNEKAYLTAIAVTDQFIFLADAGNREILRCDRAGKVLSRFGKIGADAENPGFVIPSPYFDLTIGRDGLLNVTNCGRHRIETYTLDGQYRCAWGKASFAIDGFCGCCNPVFLKILPDGRYLTSEKGITRVKLYEPDGKFRGVVAGPADLCDDLVLAQRAADDCRLGCGFDVAVDSHGEVLILDPDKKRIRRYSVTT
jgi:hypothetical protein